MDVFYLYSNDALIHGTRLINENGLIVSSQLLAVKANIKMPFVLLDLIEKNMKILVSSATGLSNVVFQTI